MSALDVPGVELAQVKNHSTISPIELGRVLSSSGYFKDTPQAAQAAVKIMAGAELGLPPIASMMGIHIVQGKVQIGYTLIAALIERHPKYGYQVLEHDENICRIQFYKDGAPAGPPESFDQEDAKRQATQNMAKFPKNMLFARCMSNGAKFHCAEVFSGMPVYVPGEMPDPDEVQVSVPNGRGVDAVRAKIEALHGEIPAEEFHEDETEVVEDEYTGPTVHEEALSL